MSQPSADSAPQPAPRPAPEMAPRPADVAARSADLATTDPDAPWQGLAIELRQVSHNFGPVLAIDNISLDVQQGTLLGIIGPSGSGKTTTIRTITGAIRPRHGSVRVLGEEPHKFRRQTREQIGYMPQLFVLYPELTARENVEFVASLFGMLWRRRRRRTEEVLRLVDLWDARNRRASHLSGGMQRRLELACSLVHEPSLLVLDEPTAGIDPLLRTQVWDELGRLRREGVTTVITTQYVSEAEYCDGVALISTGQLIAHAAPEDLRRQALGGDVIEVVTTRDFDVRSLPDLEGVVDVRQHGPRELLVVAEEAGLASPRVIDAITGAGGDVEYSREYRPTFDEVFAAIVTRHADGQAAPDDAGAAAEMTQRTMRPR
jgi:ABC-2 type transport system ATP-binding protein